jgi:hypothetical protein
MSLRSSLFESDARNRLTSIGAGIVILIAVAVLLRRQFPSALSANIAPPPNLINAFDLLGATAATQTETLAGSTGSIVIWKVQDLQRTPLPLATMQQAYDKQIAASPGLRIVARAEERVDLSGAMDPTVQTLPAAKFIALLQQYPDVDVLVLLGAVPVLSPADYARIPTHRPKVLAVDTNRLPEKRLFTQQVLQVAIVTRVPPITDPATTPTEWLDKLYMLVTPENAATLPR